MRLFPKIQSPCPYKGDIADLLVGDMCRLCNKQVVDLTDLAEADKASLRSQCGDICVRYRVRTTAAVALALGASLTALPAAADPCPVPADEVSAPADASARDPSATPQEASGEELEFVVVGGISAPDAQWVESGPPVPVEVEAADSEMIVVMAGGISPADSNWLETAPAVPVEVDTTDVAASPIAPQTR